MRRGGSLLARARRLPVAAIVWSAALAGAASGAVSAAAPSGACDKPVYLTFDTGHMGVAPLVADVLRRQQVAATFFLANERTLTGGGSLDDEWAAWWKARAAEGLPFAAYGLPGGEIPDPVARALEALRDEVQRLGARVVELEAERSQVEGPRRVQNG